MSLPGQTVWIVLVALATAPACHRAVRAPSTGHPEADELLAGVTAANGQWQVHRLAPGSPVAQAPASVGADWSCRDGVILECRRSESASPRLAILGRAGKTWQIVVSGAAPAPRGCEAYAAMVAAMQAQFGPPTQATEGLCSESRAYEGPDWAAWDSSGQRLSARAVLDLKTRMVTLSVELAPLDPVSDELPAGSLDGIPAEVPLEALPGEMP